MSTPNPPIKVILFDLDDTLILNPTSLALDLTLTTNGYPPLPPHLHALTTGYHSAHLVQTIHAWALRNHPPTPPTPPPTYDTFWTTYETIWHAHQPDITLRPGAASVIAHAAASPSLDIAIVTNTFLARATRKTAMFPALKSAFQDPGRIVTLDHPHAVSHARTVRRKPAPDLYLLALEVVNSERGARGLAPVAPEECLVFEDSVIGVRSGVEAGMRVVWNPVRVVREFCEVLVRGEEAALEGWRDEDVEGGVLEEHRRLFGGEGGVHVVETLEGFDWGRYGL